MKKEIILEIPDMHCNHCVMTIRKALEKIGAEPKEVSLSNKKAVVIFDDDKLTVDDLINAISKFGYTAKVT